MARKPKSDETVVLRRRGRDRGRMLPGLAAVGFVLLLGAGAGAFGVWYQAAPAVAPAIAPAPPPNLAPPAIPGPIVGVQPVQPVQPVLAPPPAGFPVTVAGEAEILDDQPVDVTVFRFARNRMIVVLDFASLDVQAQMLNRMAVFEEKDGFPHDRLLDDADLDRAIRGGGDVPATFYYGHDYRAAALVRFFALADRDHVALTAQEQRLRRLIGELGWTGPDAAGALISLPRLNADATIDAKARSTILRHELSHGEYFTDPQYAAFVQHFWADTMDGSDRAAFRRFLVADHYDGAIEDLIVNETQAYLMFTPDTRFFSPDFVGLPATRIAELRRAFIAAMPPGWLRDELVPADAPSPAALPPAAATGAARAPRRRRRLRCFADARRH